jgi:hypothetical protein
VNAEAVRLSEDAKRQQNWKRWGPYLSDRQWGTVREDYSANGECWTYFPHDHARSRAYRWGEDGLLGICDREGRLCFSVALWNGNDPILKERLFGLSGPEGNHGEDIKECHFHLDSSPTHSYMKALYKYPQRAYPYQWLLEENARRGRDDREFEITDTDAFADSRYFDVFVEYAKDTPEDILIRITVENRGSEEAPLQVLPTLWFRNTWGWGRSGEGYWPKPSIDKQADGSLLASHDSLGNFGFAVENAPAYLFTENETNVRKLYNSDSCPPFVKDAFHEYVVHNNEAAVNPAETGTKAAAHLKLNVPANGSVTLRCRLTAGKLCSSPFDGNFDAIFTQRMKECEEFYEELRPPKTTAEETRVIRHAYAGLLWSRQFYGYAVLDWLQGDPAQPPSPLERKYGRNHEWTHLFNRDVISMPDTWEYPWYAAWDLAFHMIPFAQIDPDFAKAQLVLLLREWYMHPNGQIPAYEFAFGDVNPPVHAWACWRVYKISAPAGQRDRVFLSRVFQKLLLNFTWWVNRKDIKGKQLFSGGFLGLDNVGIFDRSKPLGDGAALEQADGTAWMAFYCSSMLSIALELAQGDQAYEDMASKFFEHFVEIADAMNNVGGHGLWNEEEGFYYDQLQVDGRTFPLRIRSLVGLIPLIAVGLLHQDRIDKLPGFKKRLDWFLENRSDLSSQISLVSESADKSHKQRLLAIPSKDRLLRVLAPMLDEEEFLSPYGIRSVSKIHEKHPYTLNIDGEDRSVSYEPGESTSGLFGGNSNWRGPIWFPINYLLIESLERYHHFFGDEFRVECPTRSGNFLTLLQVAQELERRLSALFLPGDEGTIPWQRDTPQFRQDPHWQKLDWFFEFFHGDNGRGCGANHQTGWTALAARCLEDQAKCR